MIIVAFLGKLVYLFQHLTQPFFGRVDLAAGLAVGVATRLAREEPELHGPGQQSGCHVSVIRVLILLQQAVSERYGFLGCLVEL